METKHKTFTLKVDTTKNYSEGQALKLISKRLLSLTDEQFSKEFNVEAEAFEKIEDKKWCHNINVRKGYKIGASYNLMWSSEAPYEVQITIGEFAKITQILLLATITPIAISFGLMALNDVGVLSFLPGRKIAFFLGAFIGIIPGGFLFMILKYLLLKGSKKESKKLTQSLKQLLNEKSI